MRAEPPLETANDVDTGKTSVQVAEPSPGIHWFHPPDGGEMYILETGAGLVLVDTGLPRHKESMLEAVRSAGLQPESICLGFISHCHCDHVGAMGWWREQFDFPVVAHEEAVGPVSSGDPVVTGADIPYAGFHDPFIPCPIDRVVRGGETITVGNRTFEIFTAPGHTVTAIHIVTGQTIFVGDNLFGTGGIGWMDVHWGSNPEDYVETLKRLRAYRGYMALAGHGAPFELTDALIDKAIEVTSFYIPSGHGLGTPRAPSQYKDQDSGSSATP